MNLLEFSIKTSKKLNSINDSSFAAVFIEAKGFCFTNYHENLVRSNSHGISYFDNVIKYWDDPDSYYIPKDKNEKPIDVTKKEIPKDDYEYNFIRILKLNKEKVRIASAESIKEIHD